MSLAAGLLLFLAAAAILLSRLEAGSQPVVINGTPVAPAPTSDPQRAARGAELYGANCAACHGPELQGVSDRQRTLPDGSLPAPPHDSTGHTWHHPDSLPLEITANGGDPASNSKMPAFGKELAPEKMNSILDSSRPDGTRTLANSSGGSLSPPVRSRPPSTGTPHVAVWDLPADVPTSIAPRLLALGPQLRIWTPAREWN